jgi:hypothetical protein
MQTFVPGHLYAFAKQIRRWAEEQRAADPYCRPLWPDERYVERRYRAHGEDTYDVLVAEWERSKASVREQRHLDEQRQDRERDRLRKVREEHGTERGRLSLGERLRVLLTEAELVSYGKAGVVEAPVRGNSEHPSKVLSARMTFGGKLPLVDQIRARIENEIRRAEEQVDRERRRSLPEDNREPREDRLLRLAGLTPSQVVRQDPEQGTESQVRNRRRSLGVDEEHGGRRAA